MTLEDLMIYVLIAMFASIILQIVIPSQRKFFFNIEMGIIAIGIAIQISLGDWLFAAIWLGLLIFLQWSRRTQERAQAEMAEFEKKIDRMLNATQQTNDDEESNDADA